ncbi:MAG: Maf family protein [Lachnospiraceae bacterium]
MKKKIVLASGSPRRKELLTQMGFTYEVRVSHAQEMAAATLPADKVMELAALKAWDIAQTMEEDGIIIGADTVVALDDQVLGKPHSEQEAFDMLQLLQGRTHSVFTGVCLVKKQGFSMSQDCFFEETKVTFYPMTEKEIWSYIETGECSDKAGAYGIQGRGGMYIEKIEGDYYNVVGLPIAPLYRHLKEEVFE